MLNSHENLYLKSSCAVLFQVFSLGGHVTERLPARLTTVRLLACVDPFVLLQVTGHGELFTTARNRTTGGRVGVRFSVSEVELNFS